MDQVLESALISEVDYNDGLPNEYQTWTYDAAGNRATDSVQGSGWSYDNLNRILTSPGYVYEHDILGNRTWRNRQVSTGGVKYEWDELNRATSIVGTVSGARYEYRADGMRTDKVEGFNLSWEWTDKTHTSGYYDEIQGQNLPTSRYYYDGQMMVEDDYTVEGQYEPVVTVMRYGIGARGIDFMDKRVDDGPETKGYPIYDGHGNMIATLAQAQSSPYYSLADLRSYDVWGSVRSGSTTGDPKQRYCANLGHVQDDESGLIYMRARYYEPWCGRFVSEDSLKAGFNWYIYAQSNPIRFVDVSGQEPLPEDVQGWFEWILKKYGDYTDGMSDPRIKILAAGASACTSLTSIAARVDTASNIMTAAGLTSTWIATSMPWLGALLLSLGAVGRIAAGGMRIAAALLALATILAVLTTDVE